jgi:glucose-1-phosphate cytidylyltransferase
VGDYVAGDATVWEEEPVERLARDDELRAYRYGGFWRAMDNVRDRDQLEELWRAGEAPWKTWA